MSLLELFLGQRKYMIDRQTAIDKHEDSVRVRVQSGTTERLDDMSKRCFTHTVTTTLHGV